MNPSSALSSIKKWYLLCVALLLFVVAGFVMWFFAPSFFVDEFYEVSMVYRGETVQIKNVERLQREGVSRFTSITSTWENQSADACDVEVKSETLEKNFSLAPSGEFGIILPKGEVVKFRICGETGEIDLRNL